MRICILLIFFTLASCSGGNRNETASTKTSRQLNFDNMGLTYDLGNGLMLKNVTFDTQSTNRKCEGISIRCTIEPSEEAIQQLRQHAFSSFLFIWNVEHHGQKLYDSGVPIRQKLGEEITFNQIPFVSDKGTYTFDKHIPFSVLGLSNGEFEPEFNLEVYAVKFTQDQELKQYRKLEYISSSPIAVQNFKQKINAPVLYKGKVGIDYFKISNPDGRKYDFTLNGNGMPDPFWELCCDTEIIYSSKPMRNTYTYSVKSETPFFFLTANDTLKISVYDFDQGPFNSKDFIDAWQGTFSELQDKPLKGFGLIKDLKIHSRFTPVEK